MSRLPNRRLALAAGLMGLLGLSTGCGLSLEDVPLPRLVSGPTYGLTVEFADALNLPVDAPVKLDGATVGQVVEIAAGDYVAEVELAVSESVELRASSRAEIRLTSPMGTAFVQLIPGRKGDLLTDGDLLSVDATGTAPDVTDLLSALSTVVTGGAFGDVSTIIDELNVALTDNTGGVRSLLGRLDRAVTDLNDDFPTFDRVTASFDRLTTRLARDLPVITDSLVDVTSLVETFEEQHTTMMTTLDSLRRFETVATPLTGAVREDVVEQVEDIGTVLRTLLGTRKDLDGVMAGLVAFADGSDRAAPGDFANFDLTFLIDPDALAAFGYGDPPPIAPTTRDGGGRDE